MNGAATPALERKNEPPPWKTAGRIGAIRNTKNKNEKDNESPICAKVESVEETMITL